MSRKIELFMSIALLCCAVFLAKEGAVFMQKNGHFAGNSPYRTLFPSSESDSTSETSEHTQHSQTDTASNGICIVIDAGHGKTSGRPNAFGFR